MIVFRSLPRLRRRGFTPTEVALSVITTALLVALFVPIQTRRYSRCGKSKCSNNLKGIAIAMILYSNDHRYFPHVGSRAGENSPEDISTVYRKLVRRKYMDNTEAYICPSSEDFFIQPSNEVVDNPGLWSWSDVNNAAEAPSVERNSELSYTYLKRRRSAASARSDTMLAADKALRGNTNVCDSGGLPSTTSAAYTTVGNHTDGFNIAWADGHVTFVPTAETGLMEELVDRMWVYRTGGDPFDPAEFAE